MRVACFDPRSGVSGDMFVGALIDAGASFEAVTDAVSSLGLPGVEVRAEKVVRAGQSATWFRVVDSQSGKPVEEVDCQVQRGPKELISIVRSGSLTTEVADSACAIIDLLARAEAKVHGVELSSVHFHEVGAVDTVVDAVAAAVAFAELGIERACCSPVAVGSGTVRCSHGVLPVPAPATAELLGAVPTTPGNARFELTTPTGAAIITHFCVEFGILPEIEVEAEGYGAGSRDLKEPNVLRVALGRVGVR